MSLTAPEAAKLKESLVKLSEASRKALKEFAELKQKFADKEDELAATVGNKTPKKKKNLV